MILHKYGMLHVDMHMSVVMLKCVLLYNTNLLDLDYCMVLCINILIGTLILLYFHHDEVTSHMIFLHDNVPNHTLVSFQDFCLCCDFMPLTPVCKYNPSNESQELCYQFESHMFILVF